MSATSPYQTIVKPAVIVPGYRGRIHVEHRVRQKPYKISASYSLLEGPNDPSPASKTVPVRYDGKRRDKNGDYHSYKYELPGKQIVSLWKAVSARPVFTIAWLATQEKPGSPATTSVVSPIFRTNEIEDVPVGSIGSNIRFTHHVVNIRDDQFYEDFGTLRATRRFYSWFYDSYDFLNIVWGSRYHRNPHHITVQNKVTGIGQPVGGSHLARGSKKRLIGTINFPMMTAFDPCSSTYLHEIGHQWVQHGNHRLLRDTVPHYPPSTLMSCIMGWGTDRFSGGLKFPFQIISEGNGWFRFAQRTAPPTYNDMSLYLMGLIPKEEVGPHFIFKTREIPRSGRHKIASERFTVADYIATEGERRPMSNPRAKLRVATIVISENGLISYDEMCYLDWVASRGVLTTSPPLLRKKAEGVPPDTTTLYLATGKRLRQSAKLGRRRRRELAPRDLPGADIDGIPQDVVNINTASRRDLQRIIHIGPERAEAVVLWRPWFSVKHLVHINGIASSRMRDILDQGLAAV